MIRQNRRVRFGYSAILFLVWPVGLYHPSRGRSDLERDEAGPIVGSQRAGNRDADAAERRLVGARAFNSATYASICCSTQAHRTRECMRRPTAPRLRRCQLRRRRVQNGYKRVAAACCNDLRNLHGSPAFIPFLRLVASRRSLSEATRCPTTPSSFLVLVRVALSELTKPQSRACRSKRGRGVRRQLLAIPRAASSASQGRRA